MPDARDRLAERLMPKRLYRSRIGYWLTASRCVCRGFPGRIRGATVQVAGVVHRTDGPCFHADAYGKPLAAESTDPSEGGPPSDPRVEANPFTDCDTIDALLHQLAGAASACWGDLAGAGVFQSEQAHEFCVAAEHRLAEIDPLRAALREPSDELIERLYESISSLNLVDIIRAILAALADELGVER